MSDGAGSSNDLKIKIVIEDDGSVVLDGFEKALERVAAASQKANEGVGKSSKPAEIAFANLTRVANTLNSSGSSLGDWAVKTVKGAESLSGFAKELREVNPFASDFASKAAQAAIQAEALAGSGTAGGGIKGAAAGLGLFKTAADIASAAAEALNSAIVQPTMQFAELARQSQYAAQTVGVGVEKYTALKAGFETAGISSERFQTALQKLAFRMRENVAAGGLVDDAFTRMGVSAFDAGGKIRDPLDVFMDVSDVFKKMPPGLRETSLAMQLFEEGGANLLPVLNQGRDGLQGMLGDSRNLAVALTETDVAMGKDLLESTSKLDKDLTSLGNSVKRVTTPALGAAAGAAVMVVDAFRWLNDQFRATKPGLEASAIGQAALAKIAAETAKNIEASIDPLAEQGAAIRSATLSQDGLTDAMKRGITEMTTRERLNGRFAAAEGKIAQDIANIVIQRETDKQNVVARTSLFVLTEGEKVRRAEEQIAFQQAAREQIVQGGIVAVRQQVVNKTIELAVQRATVEERTAIAVMDADERVRKAREESTIAELTRQQTVAAGVIGVRRGMLSKEIEIEIQRETVAERAAVAILLIEDGLRQSIEALDVKAATRAVEVQQGVLAARRGLMDQSIQLEVAIATQREQIEQRIGELTLGLIKTQTDMRSLAATRDLELANERAQATLRVQQAELDREKNFATVSQRTQLMVIGAERDLDQTRENFSNRHITRQFRLEKAILGLYDSVKDKEEQIDALRAQLADKALIKLGAKRDVEIEVLQNKIEQVRNAALLNERVKAGLDTSGSLVAVTAQIAYGFDSAAQSAASMVASVGSAAAGASAIAASLQSIGDPYSALGALASKGVSAPRQSAGGIDNYFVLEDAKNAANQLDANIRRENEIVAAEKRAELDRRERELAGGSRRATVPNVPIYSAPQSFAGGSGFNGGGSTSSSGPANAVISDVQATRIGTIIANQIRAALPSEIRGVFDKAELSRLIYRETQTNNLNVETRSIRNG